MQNFKNILLTIFSIGVLLSSSTNAQHRLTGTIRSVDAASFAGAAVRLTLTNSGKPGATAKSDIEGRFHLEAQAPGIYQLDVTAPGFPTIRLYPLPITEDLELPTFLLGQSPSTPTSPQERRGAPLLIQGQILTPEARPIANALVWHESAPDHFTLTDTRGEFQLHGTAKGWLQVQAKGFLPHARRTPSTSSQGFDLTLDHAVPLAGRVVDSAGLPVAAAEIILIQRDAPWEPRPRPLDPAADRAFSAPDGSFLLSQLAPGGVYLLRASRVGLRTIQRELGVPRSAARRDQIRLEMEVSRAAIGRVVDRDENPIAGVEITQRPVGTQRHLGEETIANTDKNGQFIFEHTPARLELFARKSGYAPLRVRGLEIPPENSSKPFDLGSLVLEPGAGIHGIVQDPDGEAIAGASLWIRGDLSRSAWELATRLEETPASGSTTESGRFHLDDLPVGERFHLIVHHPSYLINVAEAIEAPTKSPLVLTLKPGLQVQGIVVDPSGQPIANAKVVIEPSRLLIGVTEVPLLGDAYQHSMTTEADGVFLFESVAVGQLLLKAFAPGYLSSNEVHLDTRTDNDPDPGDNPRSALRLVLRRGAVLAGRVTTTDGEPVVGARIEAGAARAFSDLDGDYRIESVAPGESRVEVRHRVYRTVEKGFEVEEGLNFLDFEMPTGYPLAGRVVGYDGSAVRAALELRSDRGREQHRQLVFADEEGRFLFEEVAEGPYRLEARGVGYAPSSEALEISGPMDSLVVELPREITLTGEILGLGFDELANLRIDAEHATRRPLQAEIDFDGRYTVRGMAPGDWRLRAQTRDQRRQIEAHLVLSPELDQVERDLEFGKGYLLSGVVLHGEEPLVGARISLRGHDTSANLGTLTDQTGHFELVDVTAGKYRVGVTHPRELVIHNRDISLDADLDLRFEIATSVVSGQVISAADGQPIEGASIRLQQLFGDDEGSVFASPTNARGFFGFPRIPTGSFRISIRKRGFAALQEDLEVSTVSEPLNFQLEPTFGLELLPQVVSRDLGASISAPRYISAALFGNDGLPLLRESHSVEHGRVVLPTVPPGTWRLLVQAPGSALVEIQVEVPGDPTPVVLSPAGRLHLRVPALLETQRAATARLVGGNGEPLRSFDEVGTPTTHWRVEGGIAVIHGVPAGEWRVHVECSSGEAWYGTVVATGAAEIHHERFEATTHVTAFPSSPREGQELLGPSAGREDAP